MVRLTRIYTKTGDAGQTRLADNAVAAKTDPRLEAYGTVDEANCAIGCALGAAGLPEEVAEVLRQIQNELFDVGADLATPLATAPPLPPLRVEPGAVERLEGWCDAFNADLPALRSFVLPSGCEAAARLNLARAIVRRAERAGWAAAEAYGLAADGVNAGAIRYLNRLSDLLFILGRHVNRAAGVDEPLWVPGGQR